MAKETRAKRETVPGLLAKFADIVENGYEKAAEWKQRTGREVIGCLPMHTPEEIIHAGGMLPVTLLAKDEPITTGGQYIIEFLCGLVRGKFDIALKGDLNFLDGIVFPDLCDLMQQVPDVWRLHSTIPLQYSLPLVRGDLALPSRRHYLIQQFTDFKVALEKCFHREITEDKLRQSIAIYNGNRRLLGELYQVRRSQPELFHAGDMVAVVAASMFIPKEEHSQMLTGLMAALKKAKPASNHKPRVILSNLCDQPAKNIMELIDQTGTAVVDDDLYTGSRYFAQLADETLSPMAALADRYINDVPCPVKSDCNRDWADYLINMAKNNRAGGIIFFLTRYCEPVGFDYPYLNRRLTEAGIRNLLIETEVGSRGALEQTRTRLETFVEILKGDSSGN